MRREHLRKQALGFALPFLGQHGENRLSIRSVSISMVTRLPIANIERQDTATSADHA